MSSTVERDDGEFPRLESISDCKYETRGRNDNFMAQIGTLDDRRPAAKCLRVLQ